MATIHVDVVSAEESIFSGEAKFVALPGEAVAQAEEGARRGPYELRERLDLADGLGREVWVRQLLRRATEVELQQDLALERAASMQRDRAVGQASLFGGGASPGIDTGVIDAPVDSSLSGF